MDVLAPVWLSLKVATVASALVFVPATALAYLLARRRFPGRALVETLVELPLVLPPTAVGFGLLLLLGRDGPLESLVAVLFTWWAAVIAAAVMSFPLVVRSARIAFDRYEPRLETMAASLGMTPLQVLTRVTLPLARPGLVAGLLMGFTRALGEFGATILVAGSIPGETRTLALAIYDEIQNGRERQATILLAVAVVLAFAAVLSSAALQRSRRGRP